MPTSIHGRGLSSTSSARRVALDVPLFEHAQKPPADVREAIIQHHRIRRFRGGNTKHAAYPNRGKAMAEFPFVQINPEDFRNFLVVDVDRNDADLWVLHPAVPRPHWVIFNPENGHAQAGWMIEPVFTGEGAKAHPIRYADAVQHALDRLVRGDPAFTRYLVRNPAAHSPAGRVAYGTRLEPYTLGELMRHMQQYRDPFEPSWNAWDPGTGFTPSRAVPYTAEEGGRNNALFYATRSELWRRLREGVEPEDPAALEFASLLNAALQAPLPDREVRELAASTVRQVKAGKGRYRAGGGSDTSGFLAELGRRGGQSTSTAKREAAALNAAKATEKRQKAADQLAQVASSLRTLGHTLAEIARRIGKSLSTVKRYLSRPAEPAREEEPTTQATGIHARLGAPGAGRPPARSPRRLHLSTGGSAGRVTSKTPPGDRHYPDRTSDPDPP